MKKLFKTCVIANTPCCKNADKIRSWVESSGGKYASEISADVTHLLTSKRAWIEYTAIVKAASRQKTIFIVKDAWIYDIFLKKTTLSEATYSWDRRHATKVLKHRGLLAKQEKKRRARARKSGCTDVSEDPADNCDELSSKPKVESSKNASSEREDNPQDNVLVHVDTREWTPETSKSASPNAAIQAQPGVESFRGVIFDRACLEVERDMALAGYHAYTNTAGFTYLIQLLRNDVDALVQEKHNLKLYESNDEPSTYAVCTVYSKRTRKRVSKKGHNAFTRWNNPQAVLVELMPRGSQWTAAYGAFCGFFKKKTGREWIDTNVMEAQPGDDCLGNAADVDSTEEKKCKEMSNGRTAFSLDQTSEPELCGAWSVSDGRSSGPHSSHGTVSYNTATCESENTQSLSNSCGTAANPGARHKHASESETSERYFEYIPYCHQDGISMHISDKLREQCAKVLGDDWNTSEIGKLSPVE